MTTPSRPSSAGSLAGATLIAAAAGVHVLWGTGSAWPARDRRELAEVVVGTEEFPGSAACFAVATLLVGAAGVVAAGPGGAVRRTARRGITTAFALRGVTGVTGLTSVMTPWTPSERFVEADRRFYGPLCLVIAALIARC